MIELLILGGLAALIGKTISGSGSSSQACGESHSPTRTGDFQFEHREVDGEWRAYIRQQPDYGDRADDPHSTHRYRDNRGDSFVCWSEPVRSRAESESVAKLWAKKTEAYIEGGEPF